MKRSILCSIFVLLLILLCGSQINALENYTGSSKNGFMLLYNSEWRLFNLNYRIFEIINKEFEKRTQSMMFGTSSFQLALNSGSIIEKMQSDIIKNIRPLYDEFLKSFQGKYYRLLQTNPSKYSVEKIKNAPSSEVFEALQREREQEMLNNIGSMLHERLSSSISTPYIAIMWFLAGVLFLFLRGFIIRRLNIKGNFQNMRMRVILGIAALAVISFGTFQVSRGIFFTQGITREFINEQTRFLYTSQLPETFWHFLEPYILSSLN